MNEIHKEIVRDEEGRPIAVQIPHAEWVELEARITLNTAPPRATADVSPYFGKMTLREDPVAYQDQVRDEWR